MVRKPRWKFETIDWNVEGANKSWKDAVYYDTKRGGERRIAVKRMVKSRRQYPTDRAKAKNFANRLKKLGRR